jgi:hypothetical protein
MMPADIGLTALISVCCYIDYRVACKALLLRSCLSLARLIKKYFPFHFPIKDDTAARRRRRGASKNVPEVDNDQACTGLRCQHRVAIQLDMELYSLWRLLMLHESGYIDILSNQKSHMEAKKTLPVDEDFFAGILCILQLIRHNSLRGRYEITTTAGLMTSRDL